MTLTKNAKLIRYESNRSRGHLKTISIHSDSGQYVVTSRDEKSGLEIGKFKSFREAEIMFDSEAKR